MRELVVRRAGVVDTADIAGVLLAAFEPYRPLYTPAAFAATTPSVHQLEQRWHEGPVWAAFQDAHLVGTVSAVPRGDALYMRSMAVLPARRGAGCGRRLLATLESFAADNGHRRVVLSTTPFLNEAIRLYERAGFVRTADRPHHLAGTPLFTMEKLVRAPS